MDILDILIAKKLSFTEEATKLINRARQAISGAEAAVASIDEIEEAASTAAEQASAAATTFEEMKADITAAAGEIVDDYIDQLGMDLVTETVVSSDDTTEKKEKVVTVTKNNTTTNYSVDKNYTSLGQNEDGSMTQKAITDAFDAIEEEMQNIHTDNFPASSAGSIVTINSEGHTVPSTITEEDIIATQIAAGTYKNNNIIGLEIDYVNKTFTRLQGAIGHSAGTYFDKYPMLGGRKRCIVNNSGEIVKFIGNNDSISESENNNVMVYQPAFYYMRTPLVTLDTVNGMQIEKEQIYISSEPLAGFLLHPLFYDNNGRPVKYALLSAYECAGTDSSGNIIRNDAQNADLTNGVLISAANVKPISGQTQKFTLAAAERMGSNLGTGWQLTDLRFESVLQMLMIIEYGSLNLQTSFNLGISDLNNNNNNFFCTTGSTFSLNNTTGQASSTSQTIGNTTNTYNVEGKCSISYRGLENPYGNTWRLVGDSKVENYFPYHKNNQINIRLSNTTDWINRFGYDSNYDWIFMPIETGNGASNIVPVGDYCWTPSDGGTKTIRTSGKGDAGRNIGAFYYGMNIDIAENRSSFSGRTMHIPTSGSNIEETNYQLWLANM